MDWLHGTSKNQIQVFFFVAICIYVWNEGVIGLWLFLLHQKASMTSHTVVYHCGIPDSQKCLATEINIAIDKSACESKIWWALCAAEVASWRSSRPIFFCLIILEITIDSINSINWLQDIYDRVLLIMRLSLADCQTRLQRRIIKLLRLITIWLLSQLRTDP